MMDIDIGRRLKEVREGRGLSQRQLAQRSGVTNGTISLIEQNKTSPSVSSLKKVLDGIPMPLSEFFSATGEDLEPRYFFPGEEFTELSPADMGMDPDSAGRGRRKVSLRQVGDASRHQLQILHETYPPGADTGAEMLAHEAEEGGIVIQGLIEVSVGDQVRVLRPGDGYLFDSRLPHRFRNIGEEDCVIMSACTPPSF